MLTWKWLNPVNLRTWKLYRYSDKSWSHFWLYILNWYKRSCLYSKLCTSKRKKMRKRISFLISFGIAFITHLTFKLMFCRWNCRNNIFLSNISWDVQLWEHRYFNAHWTFYCWKVGRVKHFNFRNTSNFSLKNVVLLNLNITSKAYFPYFVPILFVSSFQ